jgi:RNA polymerase sigma-70 factor (ECF subfamily)
MNRRTEELDAQFGRAWREHRRYVLDIAFRTLGELAAAEDVVQEAYARLLRVPIEEIDDVRAWLVVVTGRLCLDRMRAERRRPTSPEPVSDDAASPTRAPAVPADPADRVTLDDNIRHALHLVLERLSPAERTTFVLHDVFGFTFEEVADIVGRAPAACRQLASRARRHMRDEVGVARFAVAPPEQREVTERFIAACSTGDIDGLLVLLDPDVEGLADLGPDLPTPPVQVGPDDVAANLLRFFGPDTGTTLLSLPAEDGDPMMVAFRQQRPFAIVTISLRSGRVHHLHAQVDPEAL